MRFHRNTVLIMAALAIVAMTACGKDSTAPVDVIVPGNGTAVAMKGTLASGTLSGDIDISISGTAVSGAAPITGCVYLRSATCLVTTGSYTVATKGLTFTTAGTVLTFTGTFIDGVVQGSFTASSGSGFFTMHSGTANVYCGTFSGTASGRWNFVIAGNALDGVYNDGGGNNRLSGTVSGNNLSITYSSGTAAGTLSGASASGTWSAGSGSGTWTGSNTGCRA